eukprot:gene1681-2025_t
MAKRDMPSVASVNWNIVENELARVPQEFKDPKFYALKHVVDILTANNPQAMVTELRDQEQRLATLVDKMVQGYHSGFAKSIQNYSQILQLFGDAKEQWRKSVSLEASLKLLDDIQQVTSAPAKIDKALAHKVRGFGLEGDAAAEEVALLCFHERPAATEQLLCGHKPRSPTSAKVSAVTSGSSNGGGGGAGGSGSAGGTTTATAAAATASSTLILLSERYRSLGGAITRALRLDMLLLAAHQLHCLANVSHLCEEEDVIEVSRHLSGRKNAYVFGALPAAAARYLMWVLEDISEMNALGVERMIRSLALLQGPLCGLCMPAGTAAAPSAEVVALAADKPARFSVSEWEALLQVQVPGRPCSDKDLAALYKALDRFYHLSAGAKVVDFLEGVRTSVQVPPSAAAAAPSKLIKGVLTQLLNPGQLQWLQVLSDRPALAQQQQLLEAGEATSSHSDSSYDSWDDSLYNRHGAGIGFGSVVDIAHLQSLAEAGGKLDRLQ